MRKFFRLLILLVALPCAAHAQTYINTQNLPVPNTGSTSLQSGDTVVADRNGVTYGLFYTPSSLLAGTNILLTPSGSTVTVGTLTRPVFTTLTTNGLASANGNISNGTTFTITSGCGSGGTAPTSLTGGATTGSFVANTTTCVPIIALPIAPNGWKCGASDLTHPADTFTQTAKSTTSCTLSATVSTSDIILVHAEGY